MDDKNWQLRWLGLGFGVKVTCLEIGIFDWDLGSELRFAFKLGFGIFKGDEDWESDGDYTWNRDCDWHWGTDWKINLKFD